MTVAEGKRTIIDVLEELQRQGVWIRGIRVEWKSEIEPKDVPKPVAHIRAEVWLEADL